MFFIIAAGCLSFLPIQMLFATKPSAHEVVSSEVFNPFLQQEILFTVSFDIYMIGIVGPENVYAEMIIERAREVALREPTWSGVFIFDDGKWYSWVSIVVHNG